jgi:low temperature requirement protein LtrA
MNQFLTGKVPRLRTADPPGPRIPARIELLTDLAFVVILGHLVRRMLAEPTVETVGYILFLLVPVWWLWYGLTFYANRFSVDDDPIEFLFTSVELLGLLVMAATIGTALLSHQTTVLFIGTYAVLRVILLLKYIRARYYVPVARPFIFHIQIGVCLGLACWVGAGLVPVPYSYYLWALALVIEILTPLVGGGLSLQRRFPPDARHLPGRVATFTTLVVAQIASGIVLELHETGIRFDSVNRALLAGVTLLGLWASYFDYVYYTPVRALSEQQRTGPFWAWIYLHLPLTLLLLVSGVGLALTVLPKPGLTLSNWLIGCGVGGSYIITGLLSIVNQWARKQLQSGSILKMVIRLLTGTMLVLSAPWVSPLFLLVLCALTGSVIVLTDQLGSFVPVDNPSTIASRFAGSSSGQGAETPIELAAHNDEK